MNQSILFLIGLAITLAASLAIVLYLKTHLHRILVELCGTSERAGFWLAFSNVALVLVPLIFAMQYTPDSRPGTAVFELATQLKWGLLGLLSAVIVLAWILGRFIVRQPLAVHPAQSTRSAA